MRTAILTATGLFLSISALTSAAVRTVPDQYGSVQAAIDDCNDGDPCFASLDYWNPNGTTEDANDDFWVDGDCIVSFLDFAFLAYHWLEEHNP